MTHRFAELTSGQAERLLADRRRPVLLLPVGSTEPHGPHAPLATDPIISAGMCERVATALAGDPDVRVLVLPSLDYGVTRYTAGFRGRIHVSEEALEAMLHDICASLIEEGFPRIAIVNNHFEPEHVQTIHRALDRVEDETGVVVGYLDLTRKARATRLTEEFRRGECHAGRYETSLVLADRPELVDREAMAGLPYVPINLAAVIADGQKDFREMGLTQAYNGAPAEATAEEGEETYAALTEMLIEIVRALAAGTGGRDRSGLYGRV
ncbi:MAG: creatininase family protein [Actinobacteria bacterium]|nr:creatininase family protein [Actinomycetota bacterium]